jgi:hypothetical protein
VLDLQSKSENAFGRVFEVNEAQTSATKALAQRTTIIEADLNTPTTGLQARFTGLTTATVDVTNSTSLIRRVDTVEARSNDATASGSVRLQAVAGPTGATASYELQLTAGGTSLGVQYIVTGGVGSMVFTTNTLAFRDGATLVNVLTYSAGRFTFTSNVDINGNLIVTGTVNTAQVANNAITGLATGTSGGTSASASITTLGGDVIIIANYDGQDTPTSASAVSSNPAMPGYGTMTLTRGGTTLVSKTNNTDVFRTYSTFSSVSGGGPVSYISNLQYRQTQTLITAVDTPAAGTYTYTVGNDRTGGLFIMLLERKR